METVLEHLDDLRSRIIKIIVFFGAFSVLGYILSGRIIRYLSESLLLKDLGVRLIVTHPVEFFYTELNVAVFVGFVLSLPIIAYYIYGFLKPGMSKKERKAVKVSVPAFAGLFVIGVLFAYFVILRVVIWFFSELAMTGGVENLWGIGNFISFVFLTCISLGIVFQLPAVSLLLVRLGVISIETLKENRGFVIVGVFLLSALITPPDPLTQVLVALPMVILFEISILCARFFG
ncbi:MAG: twin-arginine translocase subunit TatC [Candidatus Aenigmarchaeota archaeon]|nr:twin-arginine translocase subunit TatC [Candidatus Aenigmarchaeota archaeon]